jgi:hypothetical protein
MANSLEFSRLGDPIEHRFDDYGCDFKEYRDLMADQYAEYIESISAEPDYVDMVEEYERTMEILQ